MVTGEPRLDPAFPVVEVTVRTRTYDGLKPEALRYARAVLGGGGVLVAALVRRAPVVITGPTPSDSWVEATLQVGTRWTGPG